METELNKLIDKIKKEGVERAERDANSIIKEANEKARAIIKDAEKRKADIIEEAQTRTQNFKISTEKALRQSARDVLLTLRERVTDFTYKIVKAEVAKELTQNVLKDVIVKAVENFRKDSDLEIEVLVSQEDRDKLQKSIFGALSQKAKEKLTITGSKGVEKGFRIGEKEKDSYIDFTDEAITEAFKRYLNPKLVELLDINLEKDSKKKKNG